MCFDFQNLNKMNGFENHLSERDFDSQSKLKSVLFDSPWRQTDHELPAIEFPADAA